MRRVVAMPAGIQAQVRAEGQSQVRPALGPDAARGCRVGARLWSETQPQRVATAQRLRTARRAAVGAPHTAALRFANSVISGRSAGIAPALQPRSTRTRQKRIGTAGVASMSVNME